MTVWRMAMRGRHDPSNGSWLEPAREMWLRCRDLGVAAITYDPVECDDFRNYTRDHPPQRWREMTPSQRYALARFIYEMQVGDVIYVKQGRTIVGRGIIAGDYHFDLVDLPGDLGTRWRHQRRVGWCSDFGIREVTLGKQQNVAIVRLTQADVTLVEEAPTC